MTLAEYKEKTGKTLEQLSAEFGVSRTTLGKIVNGGRIQLYEVAKAISDATGGVVSIKELCE